MLNDFSQKCIWKFFHSIATRFKENLTFSITFEDRIDGTTHRSKVNLER